MPEQVPLPDLSRKCLESGSVLTSYTLVDDQERPTSRLRFDAPHFRRAVDARVTHGVFVIPCPVEVRPSGYAAMAWGTRDELIAMWVSLTGELIAAGFGEDILAAPLNDLVKKAGIP